MCSFGEERRIKKMCFLGFFVLGRGKTCGKILGKDQNLEKISSSLGLRAAWGYL